MNRNPIKLLDHETIDMIAAGEVVERPSSVVKELVENAIDAGSSAISVEIRDGGIELIRVTDNGCGIPAEEIALAFERHATSKLSDAEELSGIRTLGFRGEALSSIAAVARVELITKTADDPIGRHFTINDGGEGTMSDIGAPDGTSVFVRRLFYNTPARRKFLKSPMTEGNYITDLIEKLALSHPDIAFKYVINGKEKLQTAGNGRLLDAIYTVYGRQTAAALLSLEVTAGDVRLRGYIGEPAINRGNRSFEIFYINGRYVRSRLLYNAAEAGYKGYLMQHQYPFLVLMLDFAGEGVDVNVHPSKLEVRFDDEQGVTELIEHAIADILSNREDIYDVLREQERRGMPMPAAEPFEPSRLAEIKRQVAAEIRKDSPYSPQYEGRGAAVSEYAGGEDNDGAPASESSGYSATAEIPTPAEIPVPTPQPAGEQLRFLSEEAKKKHRIIGQFLDTYWLVEYESELYIIDQHAAHEKVLYERTMSRISASSVDKQLLSPPRIVTLSAAEEEALTRYGGIFERMGYTVEHFGGREYALTSIPANGLRVEPEEVFMAAIGACADARPNESDAVITERVAEMSCKAAIKGHDHISYTEAAALIDELLSLENPYHCPHGRPTIIKMSKYELEKKFKRIV